MKNFIDLSKSHHTCRALIYIFNIFFVLFIILMIFLDHIIKKKKKIKNKTVFDVFYYSMYLTAIDIFIIIKCTYMKVNI